MLIWELYAFPRLIHESTKNHLLENIYLKASWTNSINYLYYPCAVCDKTKTWKLLSEETVKTNERVNSKLIQPLNILSAWQCKIYGSFKFWCSGWIRKPWSEEAHEDLFKYHSRHYTRLFSTYNVFTLDLYWEFYLKLTRILCQLYKANLNVGILNFLHF